MKNGLGLRWAFRILLPACALGVLALAYQLPNVFATGARGQAAAQQGSSPQNGAAGPGAQAQGPQAMEGKTAGEYYKNIQILKDIPADQLLPSMHYITVALGTGCEFCHVRGDFTKDDKPAKQTARKMMTMMFAIDRDNFRGGLQVNCNTCHRGATHPAPMPQLPELAAAGPSGMEPANSMQREGNGERSGAGAPGAPSGPSAAEILQKYVQALGGQDAISKITTLSEQGTVEAPARGPQPSQQQTMDTLRKAPDKALATLHRPNGEVTEGFDGSAAWEKRGTQVRDETGDELARVKQWAQFIPGLDLVNNPRARAFGTEKVGDHDAYRVVAFQAGGRVTYDFDTQSGLLVRVSSQIATPLGALPTDTVYDDYRDVSGIKVPFTIRMERMEGATTYKWSQVQVNVPANDSQFAKPTGTATP